MTEQTIESKMIEHLQTATSGLDGVSLQYIGTWQTAQSVKALEQSDADGIIAVKCMPRTYATPTIPDGSFQVIVSLSMRADADANGTQYLAVTDAVSSCIHRWQKSFNDYSTAFAIADEFQPTGYNIESGDCGLDADKCIWTYETSVNLYGVITDPPTQTTNN